MATRSDSSRTEIIKIVAVYALFGGLWIYFSDTILDSVVSDPAISARVSMFKGLVFIALTATLLYVLIARYVKQIGIHLAESKQAQELLARQKELLDFVVEGTTDAVYIKDLEGRYLLANSAVAKFVKKPLSEIIGYDDTHLFSGNEALTIMAQDQLAMAQSSPQMYEEQITTPDGVRYFLSTKGAVHGKNGAVSGLFGVARDITERKRAEQQKQLLEQQLLQAQKMESLGVLSGGIAHDFNNILAIITGHCYLAELNYAAAREHISAIKLAADRAAGLCSQMLTYAGKGQYVLAPLNIGKLVDEMATMLKVTIRQNVVLRLNLPADIPLINGDDNQLRQVVMNLIINASEAIGDAQGEVRISLARTEIREGQFEKDHLDLPIAPGSYVCLEVADNGSGMDDETKQRLFEPFYTTKFSGRGLGMSATLGIITAHKGALQFSSELGRGTTFRIFLPLLLNASTEDHPARQGASPVPWQGGGTILLAEDDEQIRLITKIMLEELGFSVIEAANGKVALEVYRKNASDISMVMTDIGMPDIDGYTLFRELKTIKPDLPIIISSGFGDTSITTRIPREEIAGLVCKPFDFDHLREVMEGVLQARESTPAGVTSS